MAKILIVDDHGVNRKVARGLLARHGHDVVEAASGEEALRRLEAGDIDLVVLDIDMPEMNGAEVLQRLRATPSIASTPVLAHTAIAGAGDEPYFKTKGFDALACKPAEPKSFLAICERLITKPRAA